MRSSLPGGRPVARSPGRIAAGTAASALAALLVATTAARAQLTVTLVGNAGVVVSDGEVSLLIDLPYESGAFGYQTYDHEALAPVGDVVSVVTHHHRDHFAPELFLSRAAWRAIGPPSAMAGVPAARILTGDSIVVGSFSVVVVPTPHTDDHRSYRVRWHDRVLHFVGDTEDPTSLVATPPMDVLFVTPWLSCAAETAAGFRTAARRIAYHVDPGGRDRFCGGIEVLPQGASFRVER